jgi:uncharacterized repeat protein (TIGR03837 family)
MQSAEHKPVWIVLEYLSAERWVDDAHGLPSPHPQRGLERWFFFPGFTPRTGGLIRERDLLAQRDAFLRESRSEHRAGDERIDGDDALTVSLFCYENAALPALFEAWADGDESTRCIVPEGVAERALDRFLSGDVPRAGERRHVGRLAIVAAPFVDQAAFDRRLWTSDVNIVRGEDSLVRALWAARPCCWHIYPQRQLAHVAKLEALLDRYVDGLDASAAGAMRRFWIAFNDEDAARTATSWWDFRRALRGLQDHANRFSATLAQRPDLASELVAFARARL